jgi:hypothetical protein
MMSLAHNANKSPLPLNCEALLETPVGLIFLEPKSRDEAILYLREQESLEVEGLDLKNEYAVVLHGNREDQRLAIRKMESLGFVFELSDEFVTKKHNPEKPEVVSEVQSNSKAHLPSNEPMAGPKTKNFEVQFLRTAASLNLQAEDLAQKFQIEIGSVSEVMIVHNDIPVQAISIVGSFPAGMFGYLPRAAGFVSAKPYTKKK